MAFYTSVAEADVCALLAQYGIHSLTSCTGASDGIENTTYLMEADGKPWILTLFEDLSAGELPFFARMMNWLYTRNLPVAHPLTDNNGQMLQQLSGKPALLFPRLPGQHPRAIAETHCRVIGDFLGRMHTVSQAYPEQRENPRGTAWMEQAAVRLRDHLSAQDLQLLLMQADNARQLRALDLPRGLVHADLFHDNALFDGEQLCGVIDFYNACTDLLALDLAIVINDWCALPDGGIDVRRAQVVMAAYEAHRPLTAPERQHWSITLQVAAARFWLSRLLAEALPKRPGVNHPHKPSAEYRARIQYHLETAVK